MAGPPLHFLFFAVLIVGTVIDPTVTRSLPGDVENIMVIPRLLKLLKLSENPTAKHISANAIEAEEVARQLVNTISQTKATFEVKENVLFDEAKLQLAPLQRQLEKAQVKFQELGSKFGVKRLENGFEWNFSGKVPKELPFLIKVAKGDDVAIYLKYINHSEVDLRVHIGSYNASLVGTLSGTGGSVALRSNIPGLEIIKGAVSLTQKSCLFDGTVSLKINSGPGWTGSLTLLSSSHILKAEIKTPIAALNSLTAEIAQVGPNKDSLLAKVTLNGKAFSVQLTHSGGLSGKLLVKTPIPGFDTIKLEAAVTGVKNQNIAAKFSLNDVSYSIQFIRKGGLNVMLVVQTGHKIMGYDQFQFSSQKVEAAYTIKSEGFNRHTKKSKIFSSFDIAVNEQLVTVQLKGLVPYFPGLPAFSNAAIMSVYKKFEPELKKLWNELYAQLEPNVKMALEALRKNVKVMYAIFDHNFEVWTLFKTHGLSIEVVKSLYAKIEPKVKKLLTSLYGRVDPKFVMWTLVKTHGFSINLLKAVYIKIEPKIKKLLISLYVMIDPKSEVLALYHKHGLSKEFLLSVYSTLGPKVLGALKNVYNMVDPAIRACYEEHGLSLQFVKTLCTALKSKIQRELMIIYAKVMPNVQKLLKTTYITLVRNVKAVYTIMAPRIQALLVSFYGTLHPKVQGLLLIAYGNINAILKTVEPLVKAQIFEIMFLYEKHGLSMEMANKLCVTTVVKVHMILESMYAQIPPEVQVLLNSMYAKVYHQVQIFNNKLMPLIQKVETLVQLLLQFIPSTEMLQKIQSEIKIHCSDIMTLYKANGLTTKFFTLLYVKIDVEVMKLWNTLYAKIEPNIKLVIQVVLKKVKALYAIVDPNEEILALIKAKGLTVEFLKALYVKVQPMIKKTR